MSQNLILVIFWHQFVLWNERNVLTKTSSENISHSFISIPRQWKWFQDLIMEQNCHCGVKESLLFIDYNDPFCTLKIHAASECKIRYLMKNALLYSYNFPKSAPYHRFLWCPIKSNNYFFTVKSLWAGNITKFYNVRELSVTLEFWPKIADWFKLV